MKRFIVVLVFMLFLTSNNLFAEEEKEEIHEMEAVVVTATHKMKVIDIPASISIITAKELEEMGAKNIAEALKKIPGVTDKSASRDSLAIRGTQSSMAGGPVILIDGVPQKIGAYRYDYFNFIPVSQVERIEVLRSAGIAYGPGSARGVINVITKKGIKDKPLSINASASYGSWNTHTENAGFSGSAKSWDYFFNASNYSTDGYEEEDQDQLSGLLKFGYNFSDQTRLGLRGSVTTNDQNSAYGFSKKDYQLENFRRDIHFPKSETDSTPVWHSERNQDISTVALEFSHKDDTRFIDSNASYTKLKEEYNDLHELFTKPTNVDLNDRNQDTYTFTLSGGYNFEFGGIYYTPSVGINYEDITFDQRRTLPNNPGKSTAKYDFDVDETQYGLFWDNDFLFGENWGLKVGGRVDKAKVKFENKVPNIVNEDETMFGWSVAPSYHFSEKASIYASAGKSFWFPTPQYYAWAAEKGYDLNRPEDLKPEESITYELGYKHLIHKALNIAITVFFMDYKDKFAGIYNDSGDWMGNKNVGNAETKGIEFEADGKLISWFGYRLAGAYQRAKWTSGTMKIYEHPSNVRVVHDLDGQDIYGIPDYTYTVGLDFYPIGGLKFSTDINTQGSYYVDYLNRIKYSAKTTVDANLSYSFSKWKVWILGKNILDEEIERSINATGKLTGPGGTPDSGHYIRDGRYIELGASVYF